VVRIIFTVIDQFHHKIRLTDERFKHILERPEMISAESQIKETILVPEIIKESKHDVKVQIYYGPYEKTPVTKKYLAVIVKILNHEGFVITSYYTDKIKEGKTLWKR